MVGNTTVVVKVWIQTSVEKSVCSSKFVVTNNVIKKVLKVRELLRLLDYKVEGPLYIFCNNKGVVTAACGVNMTIKKHCTALAFHWTHETITGNAVELQYISGNLN